MPWNGLNIEIYDINHYSYFHKKKFSFLRWSLLGASCIKYIYTIIQSVFSPYRVSKRMENAMKLAKIWDIWLNSVHFLGHPVWWKYTLNKYIYVFGTKGFPMFWQKIVFKFWSWLRHFCPEVGYFLAMQLRKNETLWKLLCKF